VEDFVNKKKAMEQAVAQTVASGDTADVKLQKIYARVQQIRNTGYEREKTEQELKRESRRKQTASKKSGSWAYADGREITWLFLGHGKSGGIRSIASTVLSRNATFSTTVGYESARARRQRGTA